MHELFDRLREHAAHQPDRPAIVDGHGTLTYAGLLAHVEYLADQLRARDCRMLALLADNSRHWIALDLACLAANVPCIPLPGFFSDAQLRHVLAASGADLIIGDDAARVERLLPRAAGVDPIAGLRCWKMAGTARESLPNGTAKITFTSGSSGTPKGVCLDAGSQYAVASSLLAVTADIAVERHFSVLPYATLLENIAGIYLPLLRGATVVALPSHRIGFNGARLDRPEQFLDALAAQQPHSLIVLPQFLQLFLSALQAGWRAPTSLQFIAVGGSKVPTPWLEQCRTLGLPVYEGYGLSECGSVVALNTPGHDRPGTAGRVLPHCRVKIEAGEIIVRGTGFLGYLGEPARPTDAPVHTGDLGHIDDDGYLSIDGRAKNLLISSYGRNIAPEWPETALLASGLFRHCVVLGDARPYCVALLEPMQPLLGYVIAGAVAAANRALPEYAQIRQWHCLEQPLAAMPELLTANGRPRRAAIAAYFHDTIEALYRHPGEADELLSLAT